MNMLNDLADTVTWLSDRTIETARFMRHSITLVRSGSTWQVRYAYLRVIWILLRKPAHKRIAILEITLDPLRRDGR